jgi:hypothetical protein
MAAMMWKNILRYTEAAQEKKNVANDSLLQQQKWKKDDKAAIPEKGNDSRGSLSYRPASLCSLTGRYDNPMP